MNKPEDELTLQLDPRPQEKVSLDIPTDTLASLKKVAASRDMSCEALLKLYIGQGLRQDLAKSFSKRVLEATAEVKAEAYFLRGRNSGYPTRNSHRNQSLKGQIHHNYNHDNLS